MAPADVFIWFCFMPHNKITLCKLISHTVLPPMFLFLRCLLEKEREIRYVILQMGKSPAPTELLNQKNKQRSHENVKKVTGEAQLFLKVSQMGRVLLGA